jgi:hypothetical protein
VEPMDTDDWLKSVEKKLKVVQCNNCHISAYVEAHEEPESVN